ncbi:MULTISPECIES: multiple monosaccharide ABC transporter permease [Nesterenkonia]|uniref:Xylose transport system permease protein XylH n=1 Tax=Nesterenkonia xinjiangensis TaxID=225327 RepID=A0A7Z0KAT0_9MICC|nr:MULTISPECIES: multiple monosaccharide ABC transporter permease [Nesterenkonia]MDZ5075996.1 sugar ABC transporter permease [Nesterenkonia sp. HG001]NYJ79233.1 putative multiple sugar transport system permease protein [Nesterenkonia xinjiangensis]
MAGTSNLRELLTRNLRQSGIYIAFVFIVLLFTVLTGGTLLSPGNLTNLVLQYSYILILAIGMVMIIVAGHIDLSVGSVVAFTGAVSAVVVIREGMPWWVGVIAALITGVLVGIWQGFWVAIVGIPAFIVTLAGMLIFRGLTMQTLDNVSLSPFPSEYQYIAGGFLNGLLGGPGYDVFTLCIGAIAAVGFAWSQWRNRMRKLEYRQPVEALWLFAVRVLLVAAIIMAFAWRLANARGTPVVLILLAALVLLYGFITQRTVFGRHIYAMGGNLQAAKLSGVKTQRVNFLLFINMGVLAAVAGIVYSARSNSAQPGAGYMFELDAIAAAFIGGAAVTGGVGKVQGAIIGGLIMAVMSNGMQIMGIDQSTQNVVRGVVLVLAVAFDVWNKKRATADR